MTVSFKSNAQKELFGTVVAELRHVGYSNGLIERDYQFRDWFARGTAEREIAAASFGRLPADYGTALFGVAVSNGIAGADLINRNRCLGAPVILEVNEDSIGLWAVGASERDTQRTAEFSATEFRTWTRKNSADIAPDAFLRTKNLTTSRSTFYQKSLFAGLIPELEEKIGKVLEPKLLASFQAGWDTFSATSGKAPSESSLFKVAFWLLTGKVFVDRGHNKFQDLKVNATADEVLDRVARHYAAPPAALLNRKTRDAIFERIWSEMDFRNLSVEALSQIWSDTLVTPETRKKLGIHRTRRSIVRHIIDRIPFENYPADLRYVLEPCSGSAAFLVAAMERLRDMPDVPEESRRHVYFRKHLMGFERDPFGVEISQLRLTLADYPHKNGWDHVEHGDVFDSASFETALKRARIVVCNPPFRKFSDSEKKGYGATFGLPPAELLKRVLDNLHPDGVLGFVLPRSFIDGKQYKPVRYALATRFGEIETLWLPDKGWDKASPETAIVVATSPSKVPQSTVAISYSRVREQDWPEFDIHHKIQLPTDELSKSVADATESVGGLVLRPVWEYLDYCPKIGSIAKVSKGIEWTENQKINKDLLVRKDWFSPDSRLGVPPESLPFYAFETPPTAYLSFDKKFQRRPTSFKRPWDRPKVILNKSAKSRGPWRLAAFADFNRLACFETFVAVWPEDPELTVPLTAVLNGPVANAFVWEHSGKRECSLKTIRRIPFPILKPKHKSDLIKMVGAFLKSLEESHDTFGSNFRKPDGLLRDIDALILDAYGLPPRLQHQLLDFFNDDERQLSFRFGNYFPKDFAPHFTLSEWLTGRPANATAGRFRAQSRDIPAHIMEALRSIDQDGGDE